MDEVTTPKVHGLAAPPQIYLPPHLEKPVQIPTFLRKEMVLLVLYAFPGDVGVIRVVLTWILEFGGKKYSPTLTGERNQSPLYSLTLTRDKRQKPK